MKMNNHGRSNSVLLVFLSFLLFSFAFTPILADSQFEGFDAEDDVVEDETLAHHLHRVTDLPLTQSDPPLTQSDPSPSPPITTTTTPLNSPDPQPDPIPDPNPIPSNSDPQSKLSSQTTTFDYWDEDEFEGVPIQQHEQQQQQQQQPPLETSTTTENAIANQTSAKDSQNVSVLKKPNSYTIEIVCISFLVVFVINYFTGKRENENLALAWAAEFAAKDSIFEKNFSLLGVGEGDDSPLLLKEGQNVFKFYASGRRYCSGLLATMELKSRHDLLARLYNLVVPCRDEISFEVYMNDEAMDHVVFALARKKVAKAMQKEVRDLNRFAALMVAPSGSGKKWVPEELGVVSESKEVAGDLITEAVLEQVRVLFFLLFSSDCC